MKHNNLTVLTMFSMWILIISSIMCILSTTLISICLSVQISVWCFFLVCERKTHWKSRQKWNSIIFGILFSLQPNPAFFSTKLFIRNSFHYSKLTFIKTSYNWIIFILNLTESNWHFNMNQITKKISHWKQHITVYEMHDHVICIQL